MPRTLRRWRLLKKPPGHLGSDPGGPPEGHSPRTVVAGRGARGPEEQDRAPLGPTRHPAPRPARSADEFGLHLRSDLPPGGQGRSLGPAPMRHAGHEPALGGSRTSRGSRSPWGHADGPDRMAPRQGPRRARQPHAGAAAGPSARIEPGREHLAVCARQLVVEPRVRLLRRHRRPLLLRVEPPHRPALDHHVHRPPRLGQCMRISAGWYYAPTAVQQQRPGAARWSNRRTSPGFSGPLWPERAVHHRPTWRFSFAGSMPSAPAAARISLHVVSSTGMPSASRLARITRSGSPASWTRSVPPCGGEALIHSRQACISRWNVEGSASAAGARRIVSMPLMIRCSPPPRSWIASPPAKAPPSNSQTRESPKPLCWPKVRSAPSGLTAPYLGSVVGRPLSSSI